MKDIILFHVGLAMHGFVYPKSQAVVENTTAIIYCSSARRPEWRKVNGTKIPTRSTVNVLQINRVKPSDTGYYICRGSLYNGGVFTSISELLVGGKNIFMKNIYQQMTNIINISTISFVCGENWYTYIVQCSIL